MVISLKQVIRWTKFILLFILCSFLLYQLIDWIIPWFDPDSWNRSPNDGAIKVLVNHNLPMERNVSWAEQVKNRLLIFYWLGE